MIGDLIVSIDGKPIESFTDMQEIVSTSADRELAFEVEPRRAILQLMATPESSEATDRVGNKLKRACSASKAAPPQTSGIQALRAGGGVGARRLSETYASSPTTLAAISRS